MKKIFLLLLTFLFTCKIFSEPMRVNITERSDFSKYINGKYLGLTYREAQIYIDEEEKTENGLFFTSTPERLLFWKKPEKTWLERQKNWILF